MKFSRNIMITGGAGFIGSHVVRLFVNKYPSYRIINLDKLTYAGNLANLKDIEDKPNYVFVKADICDFEKMIELFSEYKIDGVIHLAAESHVDRSIDDPFTFARTNVMGTLSLLQAAKLTWESLSEGYEGKRFYHISTDEVYGALDLTNPSGNKDGRGPYGHDFFKETTRYSPHSPYSASKASSDHFVRAFHDTYNMPTIVTNCSNNYGPYQFPEKLIPLFINNIRCRKPLPVYGKGENVRDWLYVIDHVRGIDLIFHKGKIAETYNIGGFNEWKNIDIIKVIIKTVDRLLGYSEGYSETEYVEKHPIIGITVPKLLNPDGTVQYSVRSFITLKVLFSRFLSKGNDQTTSKIVNKYLCKSMDTTKIQPVDWAIGAALFMRRDFYAFLGGFDQNYFLYMEDEDICLRSWKCNRPVVYFPESIMTHNHLRGSSKIGRKALLHLQSMFVFFKKHGCSIGSFCSKMQACSKLEYY